MFHGEQLARDGMQRALNHAEADVPTWGEQAFQFLKTYALQNEYFTGFMVTMASEQDSLFPTPENEKAWGSVYRRAMHAGLIEKTQKRMPHPRRHASEAIVYRSKVYV